mgnify:CR=1 FL=1
MCLACSLAVFAQQRITGTVYDTDANPIVGANVILKGTTSGTITDGSGKFSIAVDPQSVLQISYLGYEPREITVGNRTSVDVKLENSTLAMDEVVVVGYGTIKKADLSGSVANVAGDKLSRVRATSVSQALQGSMPGVQVTRTGSMPGASATIRVRGITTIGESDPLIIIDGVPGNLNLDVDDIESISVLKDAASASIYGARAAAGVVLVTTKRAKEGQLNIEYSGDFGVVKPTAFPGTVDYKRYMEITNETTWNDGGNVVSGQYPVYTQEFIENYMDYHKSNPDLYPLADWKSYLINNSAPTMKHNVTMSYGNKVIKSMATLGYTSADALYDHRSHTQITARVNNDLKVTKWLSANVDASYRRGIQKNTVVNPLTAAYLYAPLWSPVYSDGRISGGRDGTNTYARLHYGGFNNNWNDYLTGKFSLNITPVKNLTITGVYAPTILLSKSKKFVKQIPYYDAEDPTAQLGYINGHVSTSLEETRSETRTATKQLLINYSLDINKHSLALMAGYEDYYSFYETLGAGTDQMELSEYPYLDRGNKNFWSASGSANEYGYRSYFGRINYAYADKYLFQANIRLDQSSRFHKDYRLGVFPSFSAGWVVTEESFLKDLDQDILSFLKVRGSWGSLGNERIGNYAYQSIMTFNNALFTDSEKGTVAKTTASQKGYNIKDITWETTETWNVGIDVELFRNRLSLSADYYQKTTRDMLLDLQIPIFMGYGNPSQNAGRMHTKGWDLQVGWHDRKGDFGYSVNFNISDSKSVMGTLSGTVFDGAQIIREGSEYNEWYGYMTDGLFLTPEDRDNSPRISESVRVGDVKYLDISGPDGVPDGKISPEYDRVLLGGSLPRYIFGGNINLDYKGFDLGITFQGVGKQLARITSDMAWRSAAWHTFPDFLDGNYFSHYNTDEQNARARYPRVSQEGYDGNNYDMSDFWLFNGAYFRLKNIVLGYTLPSSATKWLHVAKVRVYVSATDPFSIDNYPKGWDPEAGSAGTAYITKAYHIGLSVKF